MRAVAWSLSPGGGQEVQTPVEGAPVRQAAPWLCSGGHSALLTSGGLTGQNLRQCRVTLGFPSLCLAHLLSQQPSPESLWPTHPPRSAAGLPSLSLSSPPPSLPRNAAHTASGGESGLSLTWNPLVDLQVVGESSLYPNLLPESQTAPRTAPTLSLLLTTCGPSPRSA